MHMGTFIRSSVVGYLAIGAILGLIQLGLTKTFEPPCGGRVEHTLWEHYPKWKHDLGDKGEQHAPNFLIKLGLAVARWLPDLYHEVISGEMHVRDYLLGGYRCMMFHSPSAVQPQLESMPRWSPQSGHLFKSESDLFRPGGRSAAFEILQKTEPSNRLNRSGEAIGKSHFVVVEPLPGVTLEVPGDWLVLPPEAIQQHVTAADAIYGPTKVEHARAFQPPIEAEGVGIVVVSMPPSMTPQELRDATAADLGALVKQVEPVARRLPEAMGFKVLPFADVSKETIGEQLGLGMTVRMVGEDGVVREQRVICIPTPSRHIMLVLSYGKGVPPVFKPILAHARETLRIAP